MFSTPIRASETGEVCTQLTLAFLRGQSDRTMRGRDDTSDGPENSAVGDNTLTTTSLSIGVGSTLESQQEQQMMLAQSVYGNLSTLQSQSRLLKDVLSTQTRGLTRIFQEKLKTQLVSATYKQLKLEQQHEKDLASLVAAYDEQFDEFRRYKLQLHQAERRNTELQARIKRMVSNHRDDINELRQRSFILQGQLQQSLREETRWKKYASLNATGKQKMLGQQLERKDRELRLAVLKRDEEINVLKKKIKEMRKSHAEECMEIRCVGLRSNGGKGGGDEGKDSSKGHVPMFTHAIPEQANAH